MSQARGLARGRALAALAVACAAWAAPARSAAPSGPDRVRIVSIRVRAFGSLTGRVFDIAPRSETGSGAADPYDDLPLGRAGREPVDSILVDTELHGPPGARIPHAGLVIRVFAVPEALAPDGTRQDSRLVVERRLEDLAFGPAGTLHEAVFVTDHLCWQDAVLVEIARPEPASMKAELPFSCPGARSRSRADKL